MPPRPEALNERDDTPAGTPLARQAGASDQRLRADDAQFMTRRVDARKIDDLPCYAHVSEMLHASFDGSRHSRMVGR